MNMIDISLNIDEYLTEEDKKEIAQEEYRKAIRQHMSNENDYTRVIQNAVYRFAFDEIDKQIDGNIKNIIEKEVKNTLLKSDSDYRFMIFRSRNSIGERANSVGQNILENAVKDNAHIIIDQVKNVLENADSYRLQTIMEGVSANITDSFIEMLQTRKGE